MKNLYSLLLVFSSFSIFAQPGTPDPTFNSDGTFAYDFGNQDNLQCVAVQPNDQKIVTAGTSLTAGFAGRLIVMRHLTDGTLDESFSDDGIVMIEEYTESYAYACHIGNDGKITVAGAAADPTYQFSSIVLRFNEDGTPDDTFGDNGVARHELSPLDDFAYNMLVQPNGQILIAGSAMDENYNNIPTVTRLHEDGSIDTDFGVNGLAQIPIGQSDNKFYDLALDSQGRIIACGHYGNPVTIDGQTDLDMLVARFTSDGTLDNDFSSDGVMTMGINDYVEALYGIVVNAQDEIFVCGYTTLPDFSFDAIAYAMDHSGNPISTFASDGLYTFNNAVQDVFYDIALSQSGDLLMAGTSGGFFFDDRDMLLASLHMDGSINTAFNSQGFVLQTVLTSFDEANALAVQNDGKILLAGKTNNGVNNDVAVIRLIGDLNSAVAESTDHDLNIWPNPAQAGSMVRWNSFNQNQITSIQLINQTGQVIMNSNYTDKSSAIHLPNEIERGLYQIVINRKEGETICTKLIIE